MTLGVYLLVIAFFSVAFGMSKLPQSVGQVVDTLRTALNVIADRAADDATKERETQRAAIGLLKQTVAITLKGAATIAVALLPAWGADALDLVSWEDTMAFSLRWDVLIMTTVALIGVWFVYRRWGSRDVRPSDRSLDTSTPYSQADRLLHRLAFGPAQIQTIAAELEASLFAKDWAPARAARPVFITSLPRAGTTVLLEALHRLPGCAAHTYRDMPFLLAPVLWSRVSSGFRRRSEHRERAHGDGLKINEDSPEAFEEVLWKKYYPHKYSPTRIECWGADDANAAFADYFREHMRKIILLRAPDHLSEGRYLSKNNGNIARLAAIHAMFPDGSVIVPFRRPEEHAISLWRQHRNFASQQAAEPFVMTYMADIGHYEFGALHRPVAFPGLPQLVDGLSPDTIDYWLAYWIAAFETLVADSDTIFLSYEAMCAAGPRSLRCLCDRIGIEAGDEMVSQAAGVFSAPPESRRADYVLRADLLERALMLYDAVSQRCVLQS